MIHPIAPHYSTLLRFDPHNYPKIIGDVAEKWSFSSHCYERARRGTMAVVVVADI